jgi:hypothetical protein
MGLDTKTYWLTDRQSQCDFDSDFDLSSRSEYENECCQWEKLVAEEESEVSLWRLSVW